MSEDFEGSSERFWVFPSLQFVLKGEIEKRWETLSTFFSQLFPFELLIINY